MKNERAKPSPEAKALSLYLMAYKSTSPKHKERSKRINRLWGQVLNGELKNKDYLVKVESMLKSFGGYDEVVERTVKFYIDKTGEWKLKGEGKYCDDAQKVANRLLKK